MAHNVWMHINAVLSANEKYDQGVVPGMLIQKNNIGLPFRELIDEIIKNADNQRGLDLIEEHSKFWIDIIGQRGYTGKRTINANTMHGKLFEISTAQSVEEAVADLVEENKTASIVPEHYNSLFE
jgi:hypothetical protein